MIVAPARGKDIFARALFLSTFVLLGGTAVSVLGGVLTQADFNSIFKWVFIAFVTTMGFFMVLSYYYVTHKHRALVVVGIPGVKIVDNAVYCERGCTVELGVVGVDVEKRGHSVRQTIMFNPLKKFTTAPNQGFKLFQGADDYLEVIDGGDYQIITGRLPAARISVGEDKYLLILVDFRGSVTTSQVAILNDDGYLAVRNGESVNSLFLTVKGRNVTKFHEIVLRNPATETEWTIARVRGEFDKGIRIEYPPYPEVIVVYKSLLYEPRLDTIFEEILGRNNIMKIGDIEVVVKRDGVETAKFTLRYTPEFAGVMRADLGRGVSLIREKLKEKLD